jgi:IS1 family transposase/transposase-like protein
MLKASHLQGVEMASRPVTCPTCQKKQVICHGKSKQGKQRYRCQNSSCETKTFLLEYTYKGCGPLIQAQVVDQALNSSGVRDTARLLHISPHTVLSNLRNMAEKVQQVNVVKLKQVEKQKIRVRIEKIETEMDEMWSFVGKKDNQRWLWHAIDHATGTILAYVFGTREDEVFLKLKALLTPFGITCFFTDGWGAYARHLTAEQHFVGKTNTQKIERKHLTLRTRIKRLTRKTICFSKLTEMHDLVIGLFINRYEFGVPI